MPAAAWDERDIARLAESALLLCSTLGEVRAYIADRGPDATAQDLVAAGVILAWWGDARGTYTCLGDGCRRALEEERFEVAAVAQDRLAHHALLFGDVAKSRAAVERGRAIALEHGLHDWWWRSSARAARLALEAGENDRARSILDAAMAQPIAELLPLLAPVGAALALLANDTAELRFWDSDTIAAAVRESADDEVAAAAARACVLAVAEAPPLGPRAQVTLRRALLRDPSAAGAVELFALAARCGNLAEARFAVDSLRAVPAPERRYIQAHYHLARAHLLCRSGDRESGMAAAVEAARAFSEMGLPRSANEAMFLMVGQERGTTTNVVVRQERSILTKREREVALLIERGASNIDIAQTLGISEHTVERHVSSILARLGLRSRWQIVF
jgi:DNA-binding CsgD family transcriptional regulator